jgi:hypothetical protein
MGETTSVRVEPPNGLVAIASSPPAKPSSHHIFDGWIDTPNCTVAVWTVEWRKLLETKVLTTRTRVRVWVSRLNCPDEVVIAVG